MYTYINECKLKPEFLSLFSGSKVSHQLNPGEARLFAWDDPTGDRKLCWSCLAHSAELDLLKVSLTIKSAMQTRGINSLSLAFKTPNNKTFVPFIAKLKSAKE